MSTKQSPSQRSQLNLSPRLLAATAMPTANPAEVIFISGVMRSGTTVLQRIVARSCGAPYIREESQIRIVIESFETLDKFNAFGPITRADYIIEYERLIAGILARVADRFNTHKLVLKDPLSLKILGLFHELMPDVKFILSIRNPLSTVASIFRVRNRQREQGKTSFIANMDFGDIVTYVARLSNIIIAMRNKENVLIVKYEDLIGRVPEAIKEMEIFLGEKVDLNLDDDTSAYAPDHPFTTPESGGMLTNSSLLKYRSELDDEQIKLTLSHLEQFNSIFGYGDEKPI